MLRTRLLSFIGVHGALLVAFEAGIRLGLMNRLYFPPPSDAFLTLVSLLGSAAFWTATGVTLAGTLSGFAIAALIAVPVGTAMGQSRRVRRLIEPIVDSLRPMPSAAIVPVAILLLGLGFEMKSAVVIYGSLWPIIINTMDGVRGVDSVLLDTARLLQLPRLAQLRHVVLPAALPAILSGLRISLGISLILAVTAEMIAGTSGLGYFILDAQRSFAFREMFAAIVALALLGALLTRIFAAIERRALFWHISVRRDDAADEDARANRSRDDPSEVSQPSMTRA